MGILTCLLIVIGVFSISPVAAQSSFEIPPVVKTPPRPSRYRLDWLGVESGGTPLNRLDLGQRSGVPAAAISDEMTFPLRDSGVPGGLSQVQGLGKSAEDWAVFAHGVPLGNVFGGGADLGVWPSFLFSSIYSRASPALGSSDWNAQTGFTELSPWTSEILSERMLDPERACRGVKIMGGSTGFAQVSAKSCVGNWAAANIGLLVGRAQGASGSTSIRLGSSKTDLGEWQFHLLATGVDAEIFPRFLPTPAHSRTIRLIPVLEFEKKLNAGWSTFSSIYYDVQEYLYAPDLGWSAPEARNYSHQIGGHWKLFDKNWLVALNGRLAQARVSGTPVPGNPPIDSQAHFGASRRWEIGNFWWAPGFHLNWGGAFSFSPIASVQWGVRDRLQYSGENRAPDVVSGELGWSRKIPSLQDRYYLIPGFFQGNSSLSPENQLHFRVRWSPLREEAVAVSAEWHTQARPNTIYNDGQTGIVIPKNGGWAWMTGLSLAAKAWFWDPFGMQVSTRIQASRLIDQSSVFPMQPTALAQVRLELRSPKSSTDPSRLFSFSSGLRIQSEALPALNTPFIPGFALFDVRFRFQPHLFGWKGLTLEALLDNLTDTGFFVGLNQPGIGRSVTLSLSGEF